MRSYLSIHVPIPYIVGKRIWWTIPGLRDRSFFSPHESLQQPTKSVWCALLGRRARPHHRTDDSFSLSLSPMQCLKPPPKGMKLIGTIEFFSSRNLSGSNLSGFGKYFGSRCKAIIGSSKRSPLFNLNSGLSSVLGKSYVFDTSLSVTPAGGHFLNASVK